MILYINILLLFGRVQRQLTSHEEAKLGSRCIGSDRQHHFFAILAIFDSCLCFP